jgi:hypothetical protein
MGSEVGMMEDLDLATLEGVLEDLDVATLEGVLVMGN